MQTKVIQIKNSETGEVKNYTEAGYITERNRLLVSWQKKKIELEALKASEIKTRKLIVMFMHNPLKSGTIENVELGGGYKAKIKVPINYGFIKNDEGKIDRARIEKALSKIEKGGEAGELIADRLVKWLPELSLSEYKTLPDKFRKIIDDVIVTSEGTPTLEIVEPKTKK